MSTRLRPVALLGILLLATAAGAAAQTTPKYEVVHRFTYAEGGYPHSILTQGSDGALYGTLKWGPWEIFRMTLDGVVTPVSTGVSGPIGGLREGLDGAFYGTSYEDGAAGAGTIFRVTRSGALTVLHEFTGSTEPASLDGKHPSDVLLQLPDGSLYGTTREGGIGNAGVVYRITPGGIYKTLCSLPSQNIADAGPRGPVIQAVGDPDGLYGMSASGGRYGKGSIFRTTTGNPDASAAPVTLHDFQGAPDDGESPDWGLIQAPDGNFYGMTMGGGRWGGGTVFKATPSGEVTILHSFAGGANDAWWPKGGVILARDGSFYGASHDGGVYNFGTVFRMTPAGDVTVLHSFSGHDDWTDGATAYNGLIEASDGTLYGFTAGGGGTQWLGTVYRIRFVTPPAPIVGYDGDAMADMPLYDAATGTWRILTSSSEHRSSLRIYWGGPDYVPVPADYDGDRRLDVAVYRPANGTWYVLTSSSGFMEAIVKTWGGRGVTPVPGDYDNDRRADLGLYDVATGTWQILTSSSGYGSSLSVTIGGRGDVPVPGDYDGDGATDVAVYARATGAWRVVTSTSAFTTSIARTLGGPGSAPVPGDYDGDLKVDIAVYGQASGTWSVLQSSTDTVMTAGWGGTGYTPVPGDYDGDKKADLAVYAPATGGWYVLQSSSGFTTTLWALWGDPADRVVSIVPRYLAWTDARRATDFDGDGTSDLAVYEPATGAWSIRDSSASFNVTRTIAWGGAGDTPVPGDYDGDGVTDAAVFNSGSGAWSAQLSSGGVLTKTLGRSGDIPLPRDYDGDLITDIAVYTPSTGDWRWLSSSSGFTVTTTVTWGIGNDWTPVPGDYDGDGKADLGMYVASTAAWAVLLSNQDYTTWTFILWGGPGQAAVPGDYDGDGAIDFTVCRTATRRWWVLESVFTYTTAFGVTWGWPIDTPLTGDYDGDGISDMASYDSATGEWQLRLSSSYFTLPVTRTLGGPGFLLPR